MSKYWSPIVSQLEPYVPGEQPKTGQFIKLNTNENPYGPSPRVTAAIKEQVGDGLRLYPDPNADILKRSIAEYYRVQPEEVFVGNGSDEILAHAFQAFFQQEAPLFFADITYSFYPVYCGLYRVAFEKIPLTDSFEIAVKDYTRPNGGILIANPNAPTGRFLELDQLETLLVQNRDSVVAVDEAYVDFGGSSAVSLINKYDNLIVIQTLSKSRSLAGLRVGFAMGDSRLIEGLERVKNSFNSYPLDRCAIHGAVAAFEDRGYFEQTCKKIISTRGRMTEELVTRGFKVIPSQANFVFARNEGCDAAWLSDALRERGILVRHFQGPRISQYLRITVGTDEQCDKLMLALDDILKI